MTLRQLARLADSLPHGRSVTVAKDGEHIDVRLGDELPDGFDPVTRAVRRNADRAYVRLSRREAAILCLQLRTLLGEY